MSFAHKTFNFNLWPELNSKLASLPRYVGIHTVKVALGFSQMITM